LKIPKFPIESLNKNETLNESLNETLKNEIEDNVNDSEKQWDAVFDFSNNDFGNGLPSDIDERWYKKITPPKRVPAVDQNELIIVREKGSQDDENGIIKLISLFIYVLTYY
jgi:hypothetical protein